MNTDSPKELSDRDRIIQLLADANFATASAALASYGTPATTYGGLALMGVALLALDLNLHEGKGTKGEFTQRAEKLFGSIPNAFFCLGVSANLALTAGAVHGMIKDAKKEANKPILSDPRVHLVIANAGFYLASNVLNNPPLRAVVEKHIGKDIHFIFRAENNDLQGYKADKVSFLQQTLYALAAGQILQFSARASSPLDAAIGAGFLVPNFVKLGNMLEPLADEGKAEQSINQSMTRRGMFTAARNLAVRPLVKGDTEVLLGNLNLIFKSFSGDTSGLLAKMLSENRERSRAR